jgi:hypothetical protein
MVEGGIIESDDNGHFRLTKQSSADPAKKRKLWLSPAVRSIFKESGREFGLLDLDNEPETADQLASSESLLSYQVDLKRA